MTRCEPRAVVPRPRARDADGSAIAGALLEAVDDVLARADSGALSVAAVEALLTSNINTL